MNMPFHSECFHLVLRKEKMMNGDVTGENKTDKGLRLGVW